MDALPTRTVVLTVIGYGLMIVVAIVALLLICDRGESLVAPRHWC